MTSQANASGRGSNCNKAIMLVTDGAPGYYEKIFAKYNKSLNVRVFSFLIGREVGDDKQVRSMACANKGRCFFSSVRIISRSNLEMSVSNWFSQDISRIFQL